MPIKVLAIENGDTAKSIYPKLTSVFDQVKKAVSAVFPELASTKLFIDCPHTVEKHSHHQWKNSDRSGRNFRAFAHTNHFPDTICFNSHAEKELSVKYITGLFCHEFGHLVSIVIGIPSTQKNADFVILKYLGIKIKYGSKARLQYVDI